MASSAVQPMTTVQRKLLIVVLVPVFMSLLAVSSINVILPSIQDTLHATTSHIQWVLTGYTLAFGILLVAGGRAGDVYGRGKLFIAGLVLFGVGSLASGLAPTGFTLDLARVIMGFGSGLLNPQTVGFIQQFFSGERRARAFASFGSVVGVSVAIGPVLGGVLIAFFGAEWGWRLTFLINVPIAIAAIILARAWFPTSAWHPSDAAASSATTKGHSGKKVRPDLDPVGTVLFSLGTLLVMVSFLELRLGLWILSLTVVGILVIVGWVFWEKRYRRRGGAPMVNLELFKTRSYANGTLLIAFYFTGITSIWVVVAMYLQTEFGFSALHASFIGLPSAALTMFSSQFAGRRVLRIGRRLVAYGTGIALFGLAASIGVVLAHLFWGISPWWLLASLAFIGLAQGFVVSPNQTLSLMEVPVEYSGSAGGVMQTGQRVGTAMGTALITTLLFSLQVAYGWDVAIAAAFAVIALMVLVSGVVAVLDIRASRKEESVA